MTTPNPTTKPARPEKLIMAKELKFWFEDHHGLSRNVRYWRLLIAACPHGVRGQYIRPSLAAEWYFGPDSLDFIPYHKPHARLRRIKQRTSPALKAVDAAQPSPSP